MTNNTKKLTAVVVIAAFITVLITVPSYSNQDNNYPKLSTEILKHNTILDETSTEPGLYELNNNYYFKGPIINNYVKINNDLWRIINIDEKNNITIIKQEGINDNKQYKFNNDYSNYNYKDSVIEKELNTFLNNELSNIKTIVSKEYCIEYEEECTRKETSKIAILNPEILSINGIDKNNNDESYLVNNNDYWILEHTYDEFIGSAFQGFVGNLGNIDSAFVDEEKTIRPIITLSNETTTSGEGTIDNPYILIN